MKRSKLLFPEHSKPRIEGTRQVDRIARVIKDAAERGFDYRQIAIMVIAAIENGTE